ncbi:MAG: adenylate/guanylate cyclase domain-containing protein [Pyrinomonadaceae bacterium]
MGTLRFKYTRKKDADPDEYLLSKSNFRKFNPSLLGLGDISKDKECFEALAVIFDLKDFTAFCDQRDPHLEVPQYLNDFLNWLFRRIAEESVKGDDGNRLILWHYLPFFAKFLGDGILFLWDARNLTREARGNIVTSLQIVCNDYEMEFLPKIKKKFTKPPPQLRCGIAQGQIISIGDESDFIGLCINVASRLQKLGDGQFSFAFTKKGLDNEEWYENFMLIKVPVRGVSKEEFVYVLRSEFKKLSKAEKKKLLP